MVALWILPLLAVGASAIVCTEHICDNVKCPSMELCAGENQFVKENGGFCGCCHACITIVDEGGYCPGALMGVPATTECRQGTRCNPYTHRCEALRKKREVESCAEKRDRLSQTPPMPGKHFPTCEEDGTYSPKQCIEAVCICVDRNGEPLKNYKANVGESINMSCKCAREEDDLKHHIGKRVFCKPNGNYKGLQCLGSKCYCVDEEAGTQIGVAISRWEADKLNC